MFFKKMVRDHLDAVEALLEACEPDIQKMADLCRGAIKAGHTVFLCGNGGSAADCQHIAAEFVGRFVKERRGLSAIALTTDTSALTAIPNDYGFDAVFQRQVEGLVREGDVLIGLSTSGNSKNIIAAVEEAKKIGASTIVMTGQKPSKLSELADVAVRVPHTVTARVQECHILIGHMVCAYVDEAY